MADEILDEGTDGCFQVCENNITDFIEQRSANEEVVKLKFLTNGYGVNWMGSIAERFEEEKQGNVQIEFVDVAFSNLFSDILNEATSQIGLYDGFITPPSVAGSVVEHDGWADLSPYIQESADKSADWSDVLLGYRKWVAQYEGKIIMYPLDGDLLSMFYRKDVLAHFGLQVPRTWQEYNDVAAFVHGKEFEGKTLTGSCVGRVLNCAGAYWASLLISSMTQTQGPWSGHLFDTTDMTPLGGPAIKQALEWMEMQAKYGFVNETTSCITPGNSVPMKDGTCVLTYNWGNSFKTYLQEPTVLRGKLGVAATPGSSQVLDRETKTLVDCDEERCKYGSRHSDIGLVNRAPYMAFGGWACAVNNYTTTAKKKRLATEFCAFASSKQESLEGIIPNATAPFTGNGQDPYRMSHLDSTDLFVSNGYERETTKQYLDTIRLGLDSENVVTDIRFPEANKLMGVLETEFFLHLNATKHGEIAEADLSNARQAVVDRIETQWLEHIDNYNNQGTTQVQVLDAYQRLRGVYTRDYNLNQINSIRGFGYTLSGVVLALSVGFAMWTLYAKKAHVVRASQPFFLVILCGGAFILGASIIPMGIDDSLADAEDAGRACMAIPWLLALGWTIVFATLYAKLLRVNKVYKNSLKFKRLQVTVRDVMLPMAIMVTWNIALLLVWTLVDPLFWKRIETSDTSSYGTCGADAGSPIWKICASLILGSNGLALVLANVEAYKARHISTEFGETKYIAMAMGSMLQVTLVGLPLTFLVDENPSATYFVRTSIVFVICMSILCLVFIPKIFIWFVKPNERRSMRKSDPSVGLAIRALNSEMGWQAGDKERKINAYKRKIADLERRMMSEGIDAERLFSLAGLTEVSRIENDDSESLFFSRGPDMSSEFKSTVVPDNASLYMVEEETQNTSNMDLLAASGGSTGSSRRRSSAGSASLRVSWKDSELPSGASDLLGTSEVDQQLRQSTEGESMDLLLETPPASTSTLPKDDEPPEESAPR